MRRNGCTNIAHRSITKDHHTRAPTPDHRHQIIDTLTRSEASITRIQNDVAGEAVPKAVLDAIVDFHSLLVSLHEVATDVAKRVLEVETLARSQANLAHL